MDRLFILGLALFAPSIVSVPIKAQAGQIPKAQVCMAQHGISGAMVYAVQVPGPSNHWAHAFWQRNGMPTIVYGPAYYSLPPFMQTWTSVHECGHLTLKTDNEFVANCYALKRLTPDGPMLNMLASFHRSLGPLPPQYGGSGSAFWAGTLEQCSL